ncbi:MULTISPECIES: DUF6629 family protein [unclassified Kitasatospora]|uniref:DUF6629 family protein n=1 Tax=unclassified Kitasatospora TaxID=2633591 RepID=UPI00070AACC2|nr:MULTISPECIES: DUF6629 family protein [unclassified Kitasatospora]KQV11857.1 hypothetical protein ASC99_35855 [Kitasatospora sp. Root107]KRB68914.1 hypothetical protein ASE03_28880 [Kitasatospora sp. Root187]
MCWSAEADLVTGTIVTGLGVACLSGVRHRRQLPLAALPLLLGVHQLVEAAVWLGGEGRVDPDVAQVARVIWALIAMPVLVTLVPFGAWYAAGRPRRLLPFLVLGVATAVPLAAAILAGPVTAEAHGHTLTYAVGIPLAPLLLVTYLLATLGPLALNPDPDLRRLGWVMAAAALLCAVLWRTAFASTWCALAALVSVLLLRWVRRSTVV